MIPKDEFEDIINHILTLIPKMSDDQLSELDCCIGAERLERREG